MVLYERENSVPTPVVLAAALLGRDALWDIDLRESLTTLEMGGEDFCDFLEAMQRFNQPITICADYGDGYLDKNYFLKETLKEVPGYLAGARSAGLSDMQANGLLLHIIRSNQAEMSPEMHDRAIWAYGEIFRQKVLRSETVDADELQTITDLVARSGERDVMDEAAYTHLYATRLGLSTQQAEDIISHLLVNDGLCGYTFDPLKSALKSLIPAPVDSDTVVRVFKDMAGEKPYYNQRLFRGLEELVTFHARIHSPQQLLGSLAFHLDAGMSAEDALTEVARVDAEKQLTVQGENVEILDPTADVAEYFFEKEGGLEVLGLPYQVKRSLQDGLEDLSKIANANFAARFEVGEGMWVFDAGSETWYSLGGKMELLQGAVRHNFLPYDISALSKNPWVFHVHPFMYESLIAPRRGSGPQPQVFDEHVAKFLMATPSRADYKTVEEFNRRALLAHGARYFITHQMGVTEYSPSSDREQLAEVSETARALRDNVLLGFDWRKEYEYGIDRRQTVARLVGSLASKLPEGFVLQLLDAGDFNPSPSAKP